jgi:Arc/MetJ-type ribon-helix-helix transcriptional regulator
MNDSPTREPSDQEPIQDLMISDSGDEAHDDHSRLSSSVKEMAARIPEQLSAIGRDISRTIERAIAAKDDYVVAVKVSHDAQTKLDQLVQAGVFKSRADAAAFLIDEGLKNQAALLEKVQGKLAEIERLKAELRGIVDDGSTANAS